ncbi:MAG TPA: DUF4294 domain-containing protein [Bacteroidales bacterium]|nr:DUF4294 domain-containing protein [Bacteroidales bacterium]HOX77396.1 DUF4294 domain-containing protein [Bacteroidales bacterium]
MLKFKFSLIFLFVFLKVSSQEQSLIPVGGAIINGDTIAVVQLREISIFGWRNMSPAEERKMTRLIRNVKVAYPYARLAGLKFIEYEDILSQTPDENRRRKIMKQVEDELMDEYGEELKKLTISQGKILIKLVDRETGESSYDIVTEFRGEFRAIFYQAFARFFGLNMKEKYDPEGNDREIENIVKMIETGQL